MSNNIEFREFVIDANEYDKNKLHCLLIQDNQKNFQQIIDF